MPPALKSNFGDKAKGSSTRIGDNIHRKIVGILKAKSVPEKAHIQKCPGAR
jgi:hypothetical protein